MEHFTLVLNEVTVFDNSYNCCGTKKVSLDSAANLCSCQAYFAQTRSGGQKRMAGIFGGNFTWSRETLAKFTQVI